MTKLEALAVPDYGHEPRLLWLKRVGFICMYCTQCDAKLNDSAPISACQENAGARLKFKRYVRRIATALWDWSN